MEILEIKKYPEAVLRKKAREIKKITPEISQLMENMEATLMKINGAGLAANQVGELKRLIIISADKEFLELINPKVIRKSKETEIIEEGCLSFPGLWLKIKRAKEVEIRAEDKEGREIKIAARDTQARVLQHEIDHLEGILFIDRLSFIEKLKVRDKLKKIIQKE